MSITRSRLHRLRGGPAAIDEFRFALDHLTHTEQQLRTLTAMRGRRLDDTLLRFKRSETLFILASGPSINALSPAQWDHIRAHDSIGFNFFLVHDFVPTLYSLQYDARTAKLFEMKQDAYRHIPVLFRGQKLIKESWVGHPVFEAISPDLLYYVNEYPTHSRTVVPPTELYDYFELLGLLSPGALSAVHPKPRSTVIALTLLAYRMGYRKVVICGADMEDDRHFWDDPAYADSLLAQTIQRKSDASLLTFTDESHSPFTVPMYLAAFDAWARERVGDFRLFTARRDGILAESLASYDWAA